MEFNKNIKGTVDKIVFSSSLEFDETNLVEVYFELAILLKEANKYGCKMSQEIRDGWGNSITVTAVPDVARHSWSF